MLAEAWRKLQLQRGATSSDGVSEQSSPLPLPLGDGAGATSTRKESGKNNRAKTRAMRVDLIFMRPPDSAHSLPGGTGLETLAGTAVLAHHPGENPVMKTTIPKETGQQK